jgi:transposase InsO family protein
MQESMTSQLVVDALMMAVWRRGEPVALLHHSDQRSPIQQRALPAVAQGTGHHLQHVNRPGRFKALVSTATLRLDAR